MIDHSERLSGKGDQCGQESPPAFGGRVSVSLSGRLPSSSSSGDLMMPPTRTRLVQWFTAFVALAALVVPAEFSEGADHRDSPRLMANIAFEGNVDINDVYLF